MSDSVTIAGCINVGFAELSEFSNVFDKHGKSFKQLVAIADRFIQWRFRQWFWKEVVLCLRIF